MKALVVHPGPSWAVADVYRGWIRGLQSCGVEVRPFNLDERLHVYRSAHWETEDGFEPIWPDHNDVSTLAGHGLHAACYQFDPDVVVVIAARLLHPQFLDMIRARGSKVVIVHTESPYEDEAQLVMAAHADVNLINDPTNIERFAELGPTAYVPHAYDPAVHRPGPSRHDFDVAWVGTAGTTFRSRMEFLEKVDFGSVRVALGGLWEGLDADSPLRPHLLTDDLVACVPNDETTELYRGSRMSFNLYRRAGDNSDGGFVGGWAMGPREVELAATGCFFARHSPPEHGGEGDQVLPMLPTFTEPGELTEIIAHYLAHPKARAALADQARAAVADRTFERHAAQLLSQLA